MVTNKELTHEEIKIYTTGLLGGIAIGMLLMFVVMTMSFIAFVLVN